MKTTLDETIQAMLSLLREAGASVHLDPHAPDGIKKAFIDMIMDCPNCRAIIQRKGA